jgi:DnaK suppressor protein
MADFSPRELDAFRRTLSERRAQLVTEIRTKLAEARGERIGVEEASSVDGGDRAFLDMASELDLAEAARDISELRDLDAAFERLNAGKYGVCTDCAVAIQRQRLQVFPSARRCNPCQTQYEANHATPHHTL